MPVRQRFLLPTALLAALSAGLVGCSSGASVLSQPAQWLTPYRSDVVQGNFIASEQVGQLKVGMPRLQVRSLLGTPLVSSLFHADRWDYVFSFKRGVGQPKLYRYTVYFQGDALTRFEGDAMPSESEFIAQLDVRRKLGPVPQLQATAEQLQAAQPAKAAQPVTAAAPAPVAAQSTSYPPLESDKP
ncbi:MAG: outer membrane protein assembly factor BamE [Betaproteobacteria bacterium]